jgi:AraC-like DNA-binding protein
MLFLQAGNTLMTERRLEGADYHSILFFFSNNFILDFLQAHSINLDGTEATDHKMLLLEKDAYIKNFQQSLSMLEGSEIAQQAMVRTKLEELFIYLFAAHSAAMQGFVKKVISEARNLSFKQIVSSHSEGNLSVSDLAFLCNMSLSTFKRRFAENFGMSPKQYFVKQKMEKALFLLQTEHRPSEIYTELGYENLSSFSNEFKRFYGASPKLYLEQV